MCQSAPHQPVHSITDKNEFSLIQDIVFLASATKLLQFALLLIRTGYNMADEYVNAVGIT